MPLQRPEYQALWKEQTQKRQRVFNQTGDKTLKPNQTGSLITSRGAAGTVTVTLPTGARIGDNFEFAVLAAQQLRIDPNTQTINASAGQTADKYIVADAIGESIKVTYLGSDEWAVTGEVGTWTVEA